MRLKIDILLNFTDAKQSFRIKEQQRERCIFLFFKIGNKYVIDLKNITENIQNMAKPLQPLPF